MLRDELAAKLTANDGTASELCSKIESVCQTLEHLEVGRAQRRLPATVLSSDDGWYDRLQRQKMVRRLKKRTACYFFFGLICPSRLPAAEFRLLPSIGLSEDVTDNVNETASGRRVEMVTRVQPGGALKYATSSSTLEAVYNLDYRYHAFKNIKDGVSHTLGLQGAFTIMEDFLKLDLNDTFSRISLDVARDTTAKAFP